MYYVATPDKMFLEKIEDITSSPISTLYNLRGNK